MLTFYKKTRRTTLTIRTKRVLVPQDMTASIGEKRKRPEEKMVEEPPMIPCITEELNHVLDKWIGDGIVRPFTISRPPTKEERKNPLFCRIHNYVKYSTKDYWTLVGFFTRSLRRGPWSLLRRNRGAKEPFTQS